MGHKRTWTASLAIAALMLAGAAQAEAPLSLTTGGRVVHTDNGYVFQWPGVYFEGRFKGTAATIHFAPSHDIFNVYLDGLKTQTVLASATPIVELSAPDGDHLLRIERATEDQTTPAHFDGVTVPEAADALPAPAPHTRQMEFIGDSYTVGYGNSSPKTGCTREEVWASTDTSQAFGPLTAQHYHADYQINAISGRGIVRNYNGSAGDPVPVAWPYVLFDKQTKYNDPDWKPQLIVIGLGTNDFTTPLHPGEKWPTRDALHADYEATYVKFVQDLRARNPQASFILMATDQVDGEIQSEAKKVMATLQSKGMRRIAFLPMNNLSFGGCDSHPTIHDDKTLSDELMAYIDAHPEIWQGK
ncbi:SGNH/GDSL hydrolase family protein [Asticcacaulis sp. EMRT-3]|uniref:SGNH/GDSL hydrolase family protein n=1 Tax=Asticcacaulis sp. EMRT-3 TaxID=3040349 RepID=UPI0024AF04C1|nr:SGNH/GDSL hydrolase family protein [Asticcacaulis sp. EMRT-3]MDI7775167.1 GDSL-type esterase/lipase family protein [Asticcacaulis sp. EMRT-3]